MRQLLLVLAVVAVLFAWLGRPPEGREVWRRGDIGFYRDGTRVQVYRGSEMLRDGLWHEGFAGAVTLDFGADQLKARRWLGRLVYDEARARALFE